MKHYVNNPTCWWRPIAGGGILMVLLAGCVDSPASRSGHSEQDGPRIPTIKADDLELTVEQSDVPVMVEFGVLIGCFRCNDMRPHFERLAESFPDSVKFCRVDFNAAPQLAAQYGATICPSYVLFDQGTPIACFRYPTSCDVMAGEIEQLIGRQSSSEVRIPR